MTYRIREVTLRRPISVVTGYIYWPDLVPGLVWVRSPSELVDEIKARLPAGRYFVAEELHKVWMFNRWRRVSREYHPTREEAQLEIDEIKRIEAEEFRALMSSWRRSETKVLPYGIGSGRK